MRAWGLVAGHQASTGPDRKASPAPPVRSDTYMREAKTAAGHRGAWVCGMIISLPVTVTVVDSHGCSKAEKIKDSWVLTPSLNRII